jgi:hypothetical protein
MGDNVHTLIFHSSFLIVFSGTSQIKKPRCWQGFLEMIDQLSIKLSRHYYLVDDVDYAIISLNFSGDYFCIIHKYFPIC